MPTAIRCGTLIDGTGADPVRGATIVIENDTIVAVNQNGGIPSDAQVIDASGLTVMPGLIDAHVHLAMWPQSLQEGLLTPFTLRMARALVHCRETLEAGVTSARDASGLPRGVKQAIDQGLFPGPRLKISVNGLKQTGGHGDLTFPSGVSTTVPNAELPYTNN
jgi:imidazolonepropionase-like amidohydrolase